MTAQLPRIASDGAGRWMRVAPGIARSYSERTLQTKIVQKLHEVCIGSRAAWDKQAYLLASKIVSEPATKHVVPTPCSYI